MFCLQRTIVFVHHQCFDIVHQLLVTLYFGVTAKGLVEDEVIVTFQRMSIYTGVFVTMPGDELL